MFGFYSNKPGRGVPKRNPDQPRTSLFFELLGRKWWDLCKVNLMYILLAIPAFLVTILAVGIIAGRLTMSMAPFLASTMGLDSVDMSNDQLATSIVGFDLSIRIIIAGLFSVFLGLGPVTAGVTYILRNFGREEHVWMWSDTLRNMKSNFKQSVLTWIMDVVAVSVVVIAFEFYGKQEGTWGTLGTYLILFVSLLYLMMHIYVYQMMITFELPFRYVLKNSLIMAVATAPKTLLMLIILAVVHIGIPLLILTISGMGIPMYIFVLLELIFLPAASMFTTNFFIYDTIEPYIKQALKQAEDNDNKGLDEDTEDISENSEQ